MLKSNVTLDIAKGATLLGSPDHADYPAKTELRAPGTQSLVSATNAEKIAITGGAFYDALIAACAVKARVRAILTFDIAHFRRYADEGVDIVAPGS